MSGAATCGCWPAPTSSAGARRMRSPVSPSRLSSDRGRARDILEARGEGADGAFARTVDAKSIVDHAISTAERARVLERGTSIEFSIDSWPPVKNEATVAVRRRAPARRWGSAPPRRGGRGGRAGRWNRASDDVALEVTLRSPTPRPPGSATNYLGGIGDVLQGRAVSAAASTCPTSVSWRAWRCSTTIGGSSGSRTGRRGRGAPSSRCG